jgi:hypothetical protein
MDAATLLALAEYDSLFEGVPSVGRAQNVRAGVGRDGTPIEVVQEGLVVERDPHVDEITRPMLVGGNHDAGHATLDLAQPLLAILPDGLGAALRGTREEFGARENETSIVAQLLSLDGIVVAHGKIVCCARARSHRRHEERRGKTR